MRRTLCAYLFCGLLVSCGLLDPWTKPADYSVPGHFNVYEPKIEVYRFMSNLLHYIKLDAVTHLIPNAEYYIKVSFLLKSVTGDKTSTKGHWYNKCSFERMTDMSFAFKGTGRHAKDSAVLDDFSQIIDTGCAQTRFIATGLHHYPIIKDVAYSNPQGFIDAFNACTHGIQGLQLRAGIWLKCKIPQIQTGKYRLSTVIKFDSGRVLYSKKDNPKLTVLAEN